MTQTIVNTKPDAVLSDGSGNKREVQTRVYTGSEDVVERSDLAVYLEQQSRSSGNLTVLMPFDNRKVDYNRQYGLRWSFHNYTDQEVTVIDRLGLPVTIFPEKRNAGVLGTFVIRREMYFDNQSLCHQAYRNILSLGPLHGYELSQISPALGQVIPHQKFGRCVSIEYSIDQKEIRNADGRLYHLPTDLVLSLSTAADSIRHPCSPERTIIPGSFISNEPLGDKDVAFLIRYVNSDVKATPKWMALGTQVFMLRPDTSCPAKMVEVSLPKKGGTELVESSSYIELIYPAQLDAGRNDISGWRCRRLSLEDARATLGICDSFDEARMPALVAERDKLAHRREIDQLSDRFAQKERLLEHKLLDKEEALRKCQHDLDEIKRARDLELERIREQNEREAHRRKISTENIKLISVLATATVTIMGMYLKLKANQAEGK